MLFASILFQSPTLIVINISLIEFNITCSTLCDFVGKSELQTSSLFINMLLCFTSHFCHVGLFHAFIWFKTSEYSVTVKLLIIYKFRETLLRWILNGSDDGV
jgi:hypothetical protein